MLTDEVREKERRKGGSKVRQRLIVMALALSLLLAGPSALAGEEDEEGFRNNDPDAPWNDPTRADPADPWWGMRRDDPTAPWNRLVPDPTDDYDRETGEYGEED